MVYIRTPFAESGTRTDVPTADTGTGSVSFATGYGPQYQEDPTVSATARRIERNLFNGLMHQTTIEIQRYQQFGVPEYILPGSNGGVAFPYSSGALVRYNPTDGTTSGTGTLVYRSLVDSNVELPTVSANWLDTADYLESGDAVETIDTNLGLTSAVAGSAVTLSLDINNITTTVATADFHFMPFTTGAVNRKITMRNFIDQFITGAFISGLSGVDADTVGGNLPSAFVVSSRAVNTQVNSGLAGGGNLSTDRNFTLDLDNLAINNSPVGTHEIAFSIGAGSARKTSITNFIDTFVTGAFISGLTGVDADTLGGNEPSVTSTSNTIVQRNAAGDIGARLINLSAVTGTISNVSVSNTITPGALGRVSLATLESAMGVQNLSGSSFTGDFTATGRITGTGGVTSASDSRLKNEYGQLDPGHSLDAVLAWRKAVTSFTKDARDLLKCNSDPQVSFYTQDIAATHPEMVTPLFDAKGNKTEYMGLAYDRTPVVLASAMQALSDQLSDIDLRLEKLEKVLVL